MQLLQENISLIYATKKREISSGYLLAGGVVLTCLHGLLDTSDEDAVVPDLVTAKVFLNGDHGEDDHAGSFLNLKVANNHLARMIWPPPGFPVGVIDLALLKIDDPEASPLIAAATSGDTLHVTLNGTRGHAVGYSGGWKSDTDPTMRDLGRVQFAVTDLDDVGKPLRAVDKYEMHRHVNVLEGALGDHKKWGGMSGAVIFGSKQPGLIGVVKARGNPALADSRLLYTPLAEVDRLDFNNFPTLRDDFWASSGLRPPPAPAVVGPPVDWDAVFDERFEDLGRSMEKRWFRRLTEALRENPEAPAHLIMIMGHREEDLNQCTRFLINLAKGIPGGEAAYASNVSVNLRFGYDGDDPQAFQDHVDMRAEDITIDILKKLGMTESAAENMSHAQRLARIRSELQEESGSRVMILTHDQHKVWDDCFTLSQRFAAFMGTLPPMSPPALVFLLVVTGEDKSGAELLEFEGKAELIREHIAPRLAINLNHARLGVFTADVITPVPEASPDDWIAELTETHWVQPDVPAEAKTAGREGLSPVTDDNVREWLQQIPEVTARFSEDDLKPLISTFQSASAPMRQAKERLRSHPIFKT